MLSLYSGNFSVSSSSSSLSVKTNFHASRTFKLWNLSAWNKVCFVVIVTLNLSLLVPNEKIKETKMFKV